MPALQGQCSREGGGGVKGRRVASRGLTQSVTKKNDGTKRGQELELIFHPQSPNLWGGRRKKRGGVGSQDRAIGSQRRCLAVADMRSAESRGSNEGR